MVTEKAFFNQTFAENKSDMKMFYTLLIVGVSTALLASAGYFTNQITLQIHPNSFVNSLAKYQVFALAIGILATITILVVNPDSKQFLSIGQLSSIAEKEKWLGINGKSSWTVNGLQLLFFVSIATGIFMFLAVKYSNSISNFQWSFIPLVLLFSLTNSLAEELIFRFGIVGGLFNHYPKLTILIISAVLFGLPHYFGNPGGVIGVLMSGVLGYILCKATLETKGLSIAWTIHFVQDVIIFTALMMMNVKQNTL
jgi:membrane protease YdiL (CAAX protease family)